MGLNHRFAAESDTPLLGKLNHQLIADEGHANSMNEADLGERMRHWLAGPYRAVIFEEAGSVVAYACYRNDHDSVYLRHLFVCRGHRRRGVGRAAVQILFDEIWPQGARVTVEALTKNPPAMEFWKSAGFEPYAMTFEKRSGAGQGFFS
jgi:GNAT superfamily N-acetyltransferase